MSASQRQCPAEQKGEATGGSQRGAKSLQPSRGGDGWPLAASKTRKGHSKLLPPLPTRTPLGEVVKPCHTAGGSTRRSPAPLPPAMPRCKLSVAPYPPLYTHTHKAEGRRQSPAPAPTSPPARGRPPSAAPQASAPASGAGATLPPVPGTARHTHTRIPFLFCFILAAAPQPPAHTSPALPAVKRHGRRRKNVVAAAALPESEGRARPRRLGGERPGAQPQRCLRLWPVLPRRVPC